MSQQPQHAFGMSLATIVLLATAVGVAPLYGATRLSSSHRQESKSDSTPPPAATPTKPEATSEKLTLERLFPEKSFFGPGARSMAFSRDGRFCAFLYTPYLERRHGEDLYLLDTKTNQIRRMTSVGRMAEFDAETRKVRDDREAKAKKAGITLASLAVDQHERLAEKLGWKDAWILGAWSGDARSEAVGSLSPGASKLTLKEQSPGTFGGELRVGLVRLPLKDGSYDVAKGELKATIADSALKVDGEMLLTFSDGALKGTVSLKEPAQKLDLSFARTAPEPEEPKKRTPTGVVGAIGERLTLGDVVHADDATINDEKDGKPPKDPAPRYSGISSFEWLPARVGPDAKPTDTSAEDAKQAEMLVMFDGDVFRLTVDLAKWDAPIDGPKAIVAKVEAKPTEEKKPAEGEVEAAPEEKEKEKEKAAGEAKADEGKSDAAKAPKPEFKPAEPYRGDLARLTRTRERESDVQYLPDGSGYTYLRNNALVRVTFGSHEIIQLDPELKDGERMVGYRISPDQKRLVFLATRGAGNPESGGRTVTIVNYRDRFAKAIEVSRHMPDDPWPESYSSVYLYDLAKHQSEDGQLERVFTKRVSGPRDVIRVPTWSPDSSRVAFAAFEQSTGLVKLLEAGFVKDEEKDKKKKDDAAKESAPKDAKDAEVKKGEEGKEEDVKSAKDEKKKDEAKFDFKIENAKVVYQFLHNGGPNTPGMISPLYLADSRRMVFITELSGFRQLHMLDPRYEELSQVTLGKYEVYPFHQTADYRTLYYTSTEGDPCQDHVFALDLESKASRRLTKDDGTYSRVAVRDDGTYLVATHVDFGALGELVAVTATGAETAQLTRLTDSHPNEAHALTKVSPEYFTYENRHGQVIHGHLFKPKDWQATDKRPLLLYVYGGPLGERNMAARGAFDGSSYFFARYMCEVHGYVTATIDPRGVSGYGAVFEKANFEQVGKPQTEDLVDGARWLAKNHGVDEKRMALHGWSFGGFQTQMVMYTDPDVFAAGIAGAGPTEWQNYNSWYSTGTVGKNEPGKVDLEKYSLLPLAKNLKGKLMLVHGMEDSNVLYQDTVRVYRELLKAKKQTLVELFVDPTGGHGLGGDVKPFGRFSKYEDFLLRTIGKWEKPKEAKATPPDKVPAETVTKPE
ncbi:MAG: S9 family peptidase [Phycisphaerae bacterium]|nr:S9 family peptidase [Phycisphaerae bacterium]